MNRLLKPLTLTSAADVLESLGISPSRLDLPDLGELAASLLERLPATADELVLTTGLGAGEVAAALAELELAGVAAEGDGIFRALSIRCG